MRQLLLIQSLLLILTASVSGKVYPSLKCEAGKYSTIRCGCIESTSEHSHGEKLTGLDLVGAARKVKNQAKTATDIQFDDCFEPVFLDLNFDRLEEDFPSVRNIRFINTQVKLYLDGGIYNGDRTLTFTDIQGDSFEGSVALTGGIDFCSRPCSLAPAVDSSLPPSQQGRNCNECVANSNLHLNFNQVEHVLLDHCGLAAYEHNGDSGRTILTSHGVKTFSVRDPFLSQADSTGVKADACWTENTTGGKGKTKGSWEVSCYNLTGNHGFDWAIVGWVVLGLFIASIVLCCGAVCVKACREENGTISIVDMNKENYELADTDEKK